MRRLRNLLRIVRRYPGRVLTRGLSNQPGSGSILASLACQELTRRYVCPAPGGSGCTPGSPRRMRGPVAIQHPAFVPSARSPSRTTPPGVTLTTFLDQTPELEHDPRPTLVPPLDELVPSPEDVAAVVEHDPTLTPDIPVAAKPAAAAADDDA